ncbi:hypothetical protein AVEN_194037-1 [Araneus ventricosus]|uniref:Uncharacterized protein n=1 Tax=Araneus ventricosus TaxID=182803 RepID=A0A4Y2DK96_ARAVE|nr:hypothetical protein AVEN_194037-1 [Araneus ventricosus]
MLTSRFEVKAGILVRCKIDIVMQVSVSVRFTSRLEVTVGILVTYITILSYALLKRLTPVTTSHNQTFHSVLTCSRLTRKDGFHVHRVFGGVRFGTSPIL